jgi:hypothetical protein
VSSGFFGTLNPPEFPVPENPEAILTFCKKTVGG